MADVVSCIPSASPPGKAAAAAQLQPITARPQPGTADQVPKLFKEAEKLQVSMNSVYMTIQNMAGFWFQAISCHCDPIFPSPTYVLLLL